MKTKLFYLILLLLFSGKSQAQTDVNSFVTRIKHFGQFVQNLQNRQPNTTGYRLDSISVKDYDSNTSTYLPNYRDVYTYDSGNLNTLWSEEMWNTNTYEQQSKIEFTYTTSGKIESYIYYYLDSNTGTIVPSEKKLFNYNGNGQLSEYISQEYDNSGQFINTEKDVYTYAQTSDIFPNEVILYEWDGNNWQQNMKGIITYNNNNAFTNILVQQYNSGTWINIFNITRTYDANDRLTMELFENWDGTAWQNSNKTEITYTQNGNILEINSDISEWDTNTWVLQDRNIYQIDTTTHNLVQSEQYYSNQSNILEGDIKQVYIYNSNEIEIDNYSWNQASQVWNTIFYNKKVLTYDMNVSKNDLILPNEFKEFNIIDILFEEGVIPRFDEFNHQILSKEEFNGNSNTNTWNQVRLSLYFYTSVSAIEDNRQITAKMYPNPFNDNIRFEVDADNFDINIYATDGKLLYQASYQSNKNINLGFLNKGIYIYKIKTDKGIATGQIIKK